MTKKNIILYSNHLFLSDLIQQSHPIYNIEQHSKFAIPKITDDLALIIVDDIACDENSLNSLSDLCTVVVISSKNDKHLYAKQVKCLKKPIIYNEVIDIIDTAKTNIVTIDNNAWVNTNSKIVVYADEQKIVSNKLTEKEFDLLMYLMSDDFSAKSKVKILNNVFGYNETIFTSTLETHLYRLRQKISPVLSIAHCEKSGYSLKKSSS